jgi:predicted metal-dependent peptidase
MSEDAESIIADNTIQVTFNQAEVERKVSKAKALLILDHPFFGTAVSRRPIKYGNEVPTAGMSATGQMLLNPAWVEPLTVKNIMFLLAHEAMHYMLAHALRRKHRDHNAWNVACDKVINDTLIDAGVGDFIDGGITMDDGRNHASEELYDENDDDMGSGGIGKDIGDIVDENGQVLDEAQIHQLEAQAKIETIQSAQLAKQTGKLPSSIERIVDEMVNVITPWHEKLERYMTSKVKDGYSWNRPNRRFVGQGIYLPGYDYVSRMGEIVIAVDTSGSLSGEELAYFNAHINRILETCLPEKVTVLYCDSTIGGEVEYTPDDLPLVLKPVGGGGTSFKPVFKWLDSYNGEIECLIYFTDGWGDQNELDEPVVDTVWLTTDKENFPFGEVITFDKEE